MEVIIIFDTLGSGKRAIGTATNMYNAIAALYDSDYIPHQKGQTREENILFLLENYQNSHDSLKNFTFERFYLWGSGEKTE